MQQRFQEPGWFTKHVFNRVVALMTRMGIHAATELPDDEKPELLRAYLKKWKWEVGAFFGGVDAEASDQDLRRIAPDHPVFRISD